MSTDRTDTDIEQRLRQQIVQIGQALYVRGLIVAGDGNISVRLPDGTLLITPANLCKGMLVPDDMVVIDHDGQVLRSPNGHRQSTEQLLHLQVYRVRPEVQAVVHAHPPTAVAATLAGVDLDATLLPELLLTLGHVPTVPYALTGTRALAESITHVLSASDALLLSYHGALTVGNSLQRAFLRMEQVEHCARILLAAHQFGGARPLSADQLAPLHALHQQIRWQQAHERSEDL